MPQIVIQGTPINIPDSGSAPDWSAGIVEFAEATAAALESAVGTYDVSPQSFTITADTNTNVALTNLSFPTTNVRSAIVTYNVERNNISPTVSQNETGTIEIVYNGSTWDLTRESTGSILNSSNVPYTTFSVTNLGQIQFSTTAIGGTFSSGKITYSAKALSN